MLIRRLRRFVSDSLENEEWLNDRKLDSQLNLLNPQRHIYAENYDLKKLEDYSLTSSFTHPPSLYHTLDKIVRTEGIYPSDQFPDEARICPKITPELYNRFTNYTRPSNDNQLYSITAKEKCKYMTGSSSLTETLQQIYFAISNFKSPDITGLGKNYDNLSMNYMSAYRKPTTFILRKFPGGIYAIDGDKGPVDDTAQILLMGGIVLEGLLTTEPAVFSRICDLTKEISPLDKEVLEASSRSFRFRKIGNLVIRSQIDCEAKDEEGKPFVFEIKTRATAPIRYDLNNYMKYLDYKITKRNGIHSSYEREYFDLVRSILLKYFFQIKIGKMDGAFIAYHNTVEIFAYEYIKIEEIEKRLFGCAEISEQVLKICLAMFQDILDDVTEKYPDDELIKVGIFANYKSDELLITAEAHEKNFEYPNDPEIRKLIEDEIDFYNAFFPGKTAYAMSRRIFPYINGMMQKEPIFLEKGDKFTFKWIKYNKGTMKFQDYMYFLHHAYKIESATYHKEFIGTWKKYNDFHVYRKPTYRSLVSNQ
ncbi:hypothetical protein SteCoe_488 [Stentor coeruleus]|uniref:Uncharacterized protein n=1 Tax=Stentor coeruleus TaxID=5963 RepID=A0A1R2D3Z8_9CILI|nr:hypothetical protein SteCoe_488 [Stentor coeruleus]